jgi:hypothetical protein
MLIGSRYDRKQLRLKPAPVINLLNILVFGGVQLYSDNPPFYLDHSLKLTYRLAYQAIRNG